MRPDILGVERFEVPITGLVEVHQDGHDFTRFQLPRPLAFARSYLEAATGEQRTDKNHQHDRTMRVDEIAGFLSRACASRERLLLSPRGGNYGLKTSLVQVIPLLEVRLSRKSRFREAETMRSAYS